MSFFDDTNNFGKVLTIAGLIMALASLASIIVARSTTMVLGTSYLW